MVEVEERTTYKIPIIALSEREAEDTARYIVENCRKAKLTKTGPTIEATAQEARTEAELIEFQQILHR
jgi:hypothetical protein